MSLKRVTIGRVFYKKWDFSARTACILLFSWYNIGSSTVSNNKTQTNMKKQKYIKLITVGVFLFIFLITLAVIKSNPKDLMGRISFGSIGGLFKQGEEEVLYSGYQAYMYWVDQGVAGGKIKLPKNLLGQLKPYYKNDLNGVRVAYTNRFSDLAMTDCSLIYFGNQDVVNKLKDAKELEQWEFAWLAHEVAHTEQCNKVGGRKKYANMWFKQASGAVLDAVRTGKFADIVSNVRSAQQLAEYERGMSMENAADKKSREVVEAAFGK